jgi:hypothetical protein
MQELLDKLMNLKKEFLYYILLELFEKDKISYTDFTEIYIENLKNKDKEKQVIINGMAIPLCSYFEGNIPKRQKNFIKAKTAYNLLKSNVFKTTKIEKEFKKVVEKFGYSEDDNGMSNKIIK